MECKFENNSLEVQQDELRELDFSIVKSQQIVIPLSRPFTKKQNYFGDYFGLSNALVTGIFVVNTNSLTKQTYKGTLYTMLTPTLTRNITVSIFDQITQRYAIREFPLAAFISPVDISNPPMKFPAYRFHMQPDFTKSYFRLNSTTFPPGITYAILLNVFYQDGIR